MITAADLKEGFVLALHLLSVLLFAPLGADQIHPPHVTPSYRHAREEPTALVFVARLRHACARRPQPLRANLAPRSAAVIGVPHVREVEVRLGLGQQLQGVDSLPVHKAQARVAVVPPSPREKAVQDVHCDHERCDDGQRPPVSVLSFAVAAHGAVKAVSDRPAAAVVVVVE
eukprot:2458975-Prymnesium_polylepis.1